MDGTKVTVEDYQHFWQDAKSKKAATDERRPARLGQYIMGRFPDSYEMEILAGRDDMKAFLDRHEDRLIAAGYRVKDILEVWDYALEALDNKCLYIECYVFHFRKLLEVVEKETNANRRRGVFYGSNSQGLLKARTNDFRRRLEDFIRRQGRAAVIGWEPSFEKWSEEAEAKAGS